MEFLFGVMVGSAIGGVLSWCVGVLLTRIVLRRTRRKFHALNIGLPISKVVSVVFVPDKGWIQKPQDSQHIPS